MFKGKYFDYHHSVEGKKIYIFVSNTSCFPKVEVQGITDTDWYPAHQSWLVVSDDDAAAE